LTDTLLQSLLQRSTPAFCAAMETNRSHLRSARKNRPWHRYREDVRAGR
jgi:hypothetical protein